MWIGDDEGVYRPTRVYISRYTPSSICIKTLYTDGRMMFIYCNTMLSFWNVFRFFSIVFSLFNIIHLVNFLLHFFLLGSFSRISSSPSFIFRLFLHFLSVFPFVIFVFFLNIIQLVNFPFLFLGFFFRNFFPAVPLFPAFLSSLKSFFRSFSLCSFLTSSKS